MARPSFFVLNTQQGYWEVTLFLTNVKCSHTTTKILYHSLWDLTHLSSILSTFNTPLLHSSSSPFSLWCDIRVFTLVKTPKLFLYTNLHPCKLIISYELNIIYYTKATFLFMMGPKITITKKFDLLEVLINNIMTISIESFINTNIQYNSIIISHLWLFLASILASLAIDMATSLLLQIERPPFEALILQPFWLSNIFI